MINLQLIDFNVSTISMIKFGSHPMKFGSKVYTKFAERCSEISEIQDFHRQMTHTHQNFPQKLKKYS